jgi:hypothetical protein
LFGKSNGFSPISAKLIAVNETLSPFLKPITSRASKVISSLLDGSLTSVLLQPSVAKEPTASYSTFLTIKLWMIKTTPTDIKHRPNHIGGLTVFRWVTWGASCKNELFVAGGFDFFSKRSK